MVKEHITNIKFSQTFSICVHYVPRLLLSQYNACLVSRTSSIIIRRFHIQNIFIQCRCVSGSHPSSPFRAKINIGSINDLSVCHITNVCQTIVSLYMASFIRGALHILSLNGIPNYDLVKTIHESHITVNGQRFVDKNATYTVPHPEHICHILYYLHFLSRYLQHKITFFSTLFAFCIVCFLFCWFVLFF